MKNGRKKILLPFVCRYLLTPKTSPRGLPLSVVMNVLALPRRTSRGRTLEYYWDWIFRPYEEVEGNKSKEKGDTSEGTLLSTCTSHHIARRQLTHHTDRQHLKRIIFTKDREKQPQQKQPKKTKSIKHVVL